MSQTIRCLCNPDFSFDSDAEYQQHRRDHCLITIFSVGNELRLNRERMNPIYVPLNELMNSAVREANDLTDQIFYDSEYLDFEDMKPASGSVFINSNFTDDDDQTDDSNFTDDGMTAGRMMIQLCHNILKGQVIPGTLGSGLLRFRYNGQIPTDDEATIMAIQFIAIKSNEYLWRIRHSLRDDFGEFIIISNKFQQFFEERLTASSIIEFTESQRYIAANGYKSTYSLVNHTIISSAEDLSSDPFTLLSNFFTTALNEMVRNSTANLDPRVPSSREHIKDKYIRFYRRLIAIQHQEYGSPKYGITPEEEAMDSLIVILFEKYNDMNRATLQNLNNKTQWASNSIKAYEVMIEYARTSIDLISNGGDNDSERHLKRLKTKWRFWEMLCQRWVFAKTAFIEKTNFGMLVRSSTGQLDLRRFYHFHVTATNVNNNFQAWMGTFQAWMGNCATAEMAHNEQTRSWLSIIEPLFLEGWQMIVDNLKSMTYLIDHQGVTLVRLKHNCVVKKVTGQYTIALLRKSPYDEFRRIDLNRLLDKDADNELIKFTSDLYYAPARHSHNGLAAFSTHVAPTPILDGWSCYKNQRIKIMRAAHFSNVPIFKYNSLQVSLEHSLNELATTFAGSSIPNPGPYIPYQVQQIFYNGKICKRPLILNWPMHP